MNSILRGFQVFSTYVEVILIHFVPAFYRQSILHVCGGDPKYEEHQPA